MTAKYSVYFPIRSAILLSRSASLSTMAASGGESFPWRISRTYPESWEIVGREYNWGLPNAEPKSGRADFREAWRI
jgi:hypothetical protein